MEEGVIPTGVAPFSFVWYTGPMSTQKPVKGADLEHHMHLVLGLNEHFIVDLNPLRLLHEGSLVTMYGRTLVSVVNGDEVVHLVVENDRDYMVRDDG